MTDFNVTVTDQDQQVLDVDVQIQTVQASDATTVVVDGETVQVVSVAASASPIVETTDEHVHLTAQEQKVEVREGGGIALTVEQTGGVGTFIALSDTPAAYSGSSGYGVRVKSTLDGVEFFDMGLASILSRLDAVEGDILTLEDNYAALELSVSGLTSTAEGHASAILQLQTDVDAAEGIISSHASLIAAVQASVTTAEGNISANAASILAMDVRVTSAEGNISSHASLLLQVSADLETAKGDILSHASSISSLQSSVTSLDGNVTALSQSVIAVQASLQTTNNNVAVNSSAISSLTASVSANESAIAANAQSIIDLGVELDAAEGNISANASDIITVDAKIDTHTGSATAHASIVQALEVSIANAQTGVTNNASAIVSLETDVSDIEGDVYAAYTVTLDVNGKITGIELIGGGSSSAFNVRADKFNFYSSGGTLTIYGDSSGWMHVDAAGIIINTTNALTVTSSGTIAIQSAFSSGMTSKISFQTTGGTEVFAVGAYGSDHSLLLLNSLTAGAASDKIGMICRYGSNIRSMLFIGNENTSSGEVGMAVFSSSVSAYIYFRVDGSYAVLRPLSNNQISLGTSSYKFRDLHLYGTCYVGYTSGTISVPTASAGGDSSLGISGATGTSVDDTFYVSMYSSSIQGRAMLRVYAGGSSGTYIQIHHDGNRAYVTSSQGDLRFYANASYAGYFNSDGDLYIGGSLSENQWSLDSKEVHDEKWLMLASIADAYAQHDGAKLHKSLRQPPKEFGQSDGGTGGKVKYGRRNSDLIQVATACIADLHARVAILEKAV